MKRYDKTFTLKCDDRFLVKLSDISKELDMTRAELLRYLVDSIHEV